jgi:hypothetical protein
MSKRHPTRIDTKKNPLEKKKKKRPRSPPWKPPPE